MKTFPRQRLSYSEKSKNDFRWAKDVIDSLLIGNVVDSGVITRYRSDYERMLSNYQLYNNQLNQKDFERECEPYGLEVGQYKDEVQPYNKTYNKIQVLLNDEMRRPFNYKAVLVNAEGIKSKLAHRDYLLRQYVQSQIQSTIQNILPNFDPQLVDSTAPIMDPETIQRYMNTKYLSAVEITANKLLKYLSKSLRIPELKNDAFKHALISGCEFIYIGSSNGEPILEVLNPLGVFYHKSPEVKYIQDGLYAGFRTYMTSGDVLDKFGSELSKEDIQKIDSSKSRGFNQYDHFRDTPYYHDDYYVDEYHQYPNIEGSYGESDSVDDWLVQHVEWRSQRKVGFLSYTNEFGEPEMDIVSEDFEVPKEATKQVVTEQYNQKTTYYTWSDLVGNQYALTWTWIPEVWSGVRIGQDIYTMIGPKEHQFRRMDNPYKVKLGYHGVLYNAMNATPVSLMDRMKPFQYLYFIIMHKLKKLIAQDKGKIFHFDTTMIDPKLGLDKTLYYLTQMNIDFYNPLQNADQPGWSQRGKVSGSTDMGTAQNIINYVNLLAAIDQQISDVAGVTRQREGQIEPKEAVTNAQNNVNMSMVVTEVYFNTHDNLWEQALDSFIQTAQYCYKNKQVVRQYVLDDLSIDTLEITPDNFNNIDLGIFVSNSPREEMIFESLKGLSQALVQNDKASMSDLIKMLKSSSIEELQSMIVESEAKAEQMAAQQAQQQMEMQQQLMQQQQEFELEKQARELDAKILIAEMDSFKFQRDQDINDNNVPDQFEILKFQQQADLQLRKLQLDEYRTKNEIRQRDEEIKIKKRQSNKPAAK